MKMVTNAVECVYEYFHSNHNVAKWHKCEGMSNFQRLWPEVLVSSEKWIHETLQRRLKYDHSI